MGYASRLSPEAKRAEHLAALRRAARALKTPADLERYLALGPAADREAMRDILTPLCSFATNEECRSSVMRTIHRNSTPITRHFDDPKLREALRRG